jgi:hypothetical protein
VDRREGIRKKATQKKRFLKNYSFYRFLNKEEKKR